MVLDSVCRIRSRVTPYTLPISSRVLGCPSISPNRMDTTVASRSESVPSTECSCSCSSVKLTASAGWMASESSIRSPNSLSPSSPSGRCREIGSRPYFCTSVSLSRVTEVQKYGREPISLHLPLGEDGDSEFGDLIEDSEAIQPAEAVSFTLLQEQLHSVLGTLSEREATVVSMRFGLIDGQPKTLDEIGRVYGVTRERIRQIESRTMYKLRHPSRSKLLRDYLD